MTTLKPRARRRKAALVEVAEKEVKAEKRVFLNERFFIHLYSYNEEFKELSPIDTLLSYIEEYIWLN